MPYSIEEHKHRFAAWAASRAASVNPNRFPVEIGRKILDNLGIKKFIGKPDTLPNKQNIDRKHRKWRMKAITIAKANGYNFSHGIASKLINIYFKSIFVCGGHHDHPNVKSLHPPIDSIILRELRAKNVGGLGNKWRYYQQEKWSKFDSETYEELINDIRTIIPPNKGLWTIEEYWRGHQ